MHGSHDSGLNSGDNDEAEDSADDVALIRQPQTTTRRSKWTPTHSVVFIITFLSYALFHASRKTLSTVKASMKEAWMPYNASLQPASRWGGAALFSDAAAADAFLGLLDAIFMFAYAFMLYVSGWVGDRWDQRSVICVGMLGSGVSLLAFGAAPAWRCSYSEWWYMGWYVAFGGWQALGWPNEVAVMANWFGGRRGLVLGLWSACQPVGNVIGAQLVAAVLPFGYEYAFVVTSSLMVAGSVVVYFGLVSHPSQCGMQAVGVEVAEKRSSGGAEYAAIDESAESRAAEPIAFWRAVLLPGVLAYCLCNACLKLVNYAFFFWLPFYLVEGLHFDELMADQLSIWYDLGGILGSVVGGFVSDLIGVRSPVIVIMLTASLGALFGYSKTPGVVLLNAAVMAVVGALVSGPYNLIVATISADLGSQPALRHASALSTVTGLVDGTGSLGSAFGQLAVPLLTDRLGWHAVFYLFILMNFLAVVCLLRKFYADLKWLFRRGDDDEEGNLL